jgi:hypothetical protein
VSQSASESQPNRCSIYRIAPGAADSHSTNRG